jgi:hypothetical protein
MGGRKERSTSLTKLILIIAGSYLALCVLLPFIFWKLFTAMIKSYYGEDKKDARNEICPSCGGKNCKRDGYPWDICDKCGYSYPDGQTSSLLL